MRSVVQYRLTGVIFNLTALRVADSCGTPISERTYLLFLMRNLVPTWHRSCVSLRNIGDLLRVPEVRIRSDVLPPRPGTCSHVGFMSPCMH